VNAAHVLATGYGASSERHTVIDLRLAPAALVVWAVTLIGLFQGWTVAAMLAVLAFAAVPVVWLIAKWRPWVHGTLAVLLMGGVAATGMALRTYQVEQHPLRDFAAHGGRTTVRVTLKEAPHPLQGASFGDHRAGDRARVRAELQAVEVPGHRILTGGEVILLVPTAPWRGLIPGQEVTVSAKAVPARPGELSVAALQTSRPPGDVAAAPGWQRAAEDLRAGLRQSSAAVLAPAPAALLPGLVEGDTSGLPPEVVREFNTVGLTHLTAVSGANLAIVCGAALLVLRFLGVGPVLVAVAAGVALVGFVVLSGPEPSVLRAAVMGAIALLALGLGRERSAFPALSGSVLGLLLLLPSLAISAGFALSVLATAGLILLAPIWCTALRQKGVPPGVAEALAVPAAAHVVTAPLVAAISGEVSVVAVVANLLAEPVIAPATVFGVLATVAAPVWAWLARVFVWLSAPELEWVLAVAHHGAAMPGAAFEWPSGVFGGVLLAALLAILPVALRIKRIRWTLAALVLIATAVVVPVRLFAPRWPVPGWSMVACDVGQGDGLVLATGQPGEAVVVDTGPDPALIGNCLRRLGVRRVPLLVLTHLHADHMSGLSAVLADRAVAAVGIGGLREPGWALADVSRAMRARGVRMVPLSAGQQARWPGLVLDVLGPVGTLARTDSADDANDASVVLRATTPAGRILLTGDVELAGQSQLMSAGVDLHADVLKVPHHGSRYTTRRFLDAVHPRLALISVGAGNSYGHPSPLLLGTTARAGARVLRTDQEGDIAVVPSPQGPLAVARGDPVPARHR
jgi:competence protein ComEC